MKRLAGTISALVLITMLVMGTLSVSAYDYEISLSAGNGTFESGARVKSTTAGSITVTSNSTTFTLGDDYTLTEMPDGEAPEASKYFVRGIKLAGDDNDDYYAAGTISVTGDDTPEVYKNKDLEFVVAYGLKSGMVTYRVNYVDVNGNTIHDADTFYGVAGDEVIISYKYVDGYLPQAWTGKATLSSDPDENVFTFWYYEVDANGNIINIIDAVPGGAAGGAGGAGAAGADGTNIADAATPLADGPADVVDLNDNDTPLVDGSDITDSNTPAANWPLIGGGAALIALIAAIAIFLARRRKEQEETEEE